MKYICNSDLPFSECELAILRNAVDKAEDIKGYEMANSDDIKKVIKVVEEFINKNSLICYGGTAINNILPEYDQFYDKDKEIPDYDFFSPNALQHAKQLADIYNSMGYDEVEAKAGQHYGTYKVFVNFTPIADITQVSTELYSKLKKESITVNKILYTPPNMLRMSMYLELSRPAGDISRWEKVLKRLTLLNKHYPIKTKNCSYQYFTRKMEGNKSNDLFYLCRDYFINNGVVFFGGWASSVFSKYMNETTRKAIKKNPDFDVISENAKDTATFLKKLLQDNEFKNVEIIERQNLDEIIPKHYEIKVGKDTIAYIYQSIACYSFNYVNIDNKKAKIATIDTMLSLFLAFLYAKRDYYDPERILCMANFLFKIQQKNRLAQKGVLKRFTINCYGTQATKESMRAAKGAKFEELKDKRESKEFEAWFLNYKPSEDKHKTKKTRSTKVTKKKQKRRSNRTIRNSIKRLLNPIIQ